MPPPQPSSLPRALQSARTSDLAAEPQLSVVCVAHWYVSLVFVEVDSASYLRDRARLSGIELVSFVFTHHVYNKVCEPCARFDFSGRHTVIRAQILGELDS